MGKRGPYLLFHCFFVRHLSGEFAANKDYTTGRPYIEACKFGTQTLSCQQITSICVTWSTPKNTPPSIQVASRTCRLYITACKFITQLA